MAEYARDADAIDLDHLARLWYDGWQEAHAPILPRELARYRTLESFRSRLAAALLTDVEQRLAARQILTSRPPVQAICITIPLRSVADQPQSR